MICLVMDKVSISLIFSLFMIAAVYFPGGVIVMGISCQNSDVDHWDWLFSVTVPFYGIAEAFLC